MSAPKHAGKFRPRIRRAHIDDTHRLDANPRRLGKEQARRVARFNAAPELFLGREQQMLVERISRNGKFNPLAAAGDDRERRRRGRWLPTCCAGVAPYTFRLPLPLRMTTGA